MACYATVENRSEFPRQAAKDKHTFFFRALVRLLFSCYVVSDSLVTPWTVAHKAPLSMGFPKQEYWNGLPFPTPGDLPNPGIELTSLAL